MIEETVRELEERLIDMPTLEEEKRAELQAILRELSSELSELAKTSREQAESISGFTGVSAREAMRIEQNPDLLKLGIDGLSRSVEGFETDHPRLVEVVNSLCLMLSGIGI